MTSSVWFSDIWERAAVAVNAAVIFQAFFVTALTLMSVAAYRKHSALKHIIAVSVAHVGFILISVYNIYTETVPTFSWRVLFLFILYVLSDYSLVVLLRRGRFVDYYERLKEAGKITDEGKPVESVIPK